MRPKGRRPRFSAVFRLPLIRGGSHVLIELDLELARDDVCRGRADRTDLEKVVPFPHVEEPLIEMGRAQQAVQLVFAHPLPQ
ncbi:hypothetical protein D3C71_1561830 [compost metagenome]